MTTFSMAAGTLVPKSLDIWFPGGKCHGWKSEGLHKGHKRALSSVHCHSKMNFIASPGQAFTWCFSLPHFHLHLYCSDSSKCFKSVRKLWNHFINKKSTIFFEGHCMTDKLIIILSLMPNRPLPGWSMSPGVPELIKGNKVSTLVMGLSIYTYNMSGM